MKRIYSTIGKNAFADYMPSHTRDALTKLGYKVFVSTTNEDGVPQTYRVSWQ